MKDNIIATGINIHGLGVSITTFTHPLFNDKEILEADSYELSELFVPEGIVFLSCRNNPLISLVLPKSAELVICEKELFDYDICESKNVNIFYEEINPDER